MNMNEPPHGVTTHAARRDRLMQAMRAGVAVIPTAPERTRNRDTHYPYRFEIGRASCRERVYVLV